MPIMRERTQIVAHEIATRESMENCIIFIGVSGKCVITPTRLEYGQI